MVHEIKFNPDDDMETAVLVTVVSALEELPDIGSRARVPWYAAERYSVPLEVAAQRVLQVM
jgi:hypothetical protein